MSTGGQGEFRNGGRALAGSLLGAGCGLSSISFYTHSVFVAPISTDTGWSRGDVQFGITIMILMAIVTAPIVGMLMDRFGARRIALVSVPLYGITLASLGLSTDSIWTYYLAWAVMSILAAGTLPVTWTRVVNSWFDRYRGLALGITLAGTGIAATFGPTYATWLIGEYGWRSAYMLIAATITVIAIPSVYFLFREPDAASAPTPAATSATPNTSAIQGIAPGEALSRYRFWAMGIGLVLAAAGISGLITNVVPMLIDQGLQAADAARYAGLIGISVIIGRWVVGALVDRFWAPLVAAVFLSAPAIAAVVLSGSAPPAFAISVSMVLIGLAAGAELDLMAFLISRYFGLKHYGALYGALYVFFSIGAGLAPVTFGKVFDAIGSYGPILIIVAAMSAGGGLLMLTLGRYPKAFSRSADSDPH